MPPRPRVLPDLDCTADPTFVLGEQMLAGAFDRWPKRRENFRIAEVNATDDLSSAEWCDRRTHRASHTIAVLFVSPGQDEQR
jgi:hypothetical protein